MAELIDGKAIGAQVREELAKRVSDAGITPGFCDILVGDDAASAKYVGMKNAAAESIGGVAFDRRLPEDVSQAELMKVIVDLNADPVVHGFLVQLPLPSHIDPYVIQSAVDPAKDLDCFHPENQGLLMLGRPRFKPATPYGVCELLKRSGIETSGRHAVVIGRSSLVGRPLSVLLSARDFNATVTLCHTGTKDLASLTRQADILISAAGRAGCVTGDMVQPGAVVIDVGTNVGPDGKLVGDCAADVAEVAGKLTPVPGGVGPMTVAMLLANTVQAAGA